MMTPLEQRLAEEVAAQRETIKAQQVEIKLLKEKIDLLVRRVFGAKSEQLDERQLTLLLQGDEPPKKAPASGSDATGLEAEIAKAGEVPGRRKPRPRGEPRVPERLPVVEEVIEPEEVVADPQAWRLMGQEVTEQLDYEPAKFLRRRLIRRKYVRRDHPYKAPVIAPLNVLQERSIAAPGLLAAIIVAKYCDHLPLYRQEQIYRSRHRIDIPRQSMARDSAPMQAGWVLLQLAHLYRIEARLRNARAGPRLCQARRSAESRPIIARLRAVLEKLRQQRRHLPRSAMGKALSYALSLWPMLEVYLEDGRVRIDNNEVENAIRPTAIGKKNWLFIGEAEAGQRSAILYTIIEACRSRGIDPWAYLRDVLTCLPSMTNRQLKDVLPEAWAKDRQTAQRLAA